LRMAKSRRFSNNLRNSDRSRCAFGLTLYKTFRRHGLQLLDGL